MLAPEYVYQGQRTTCSKSIDDTIQHGDFPSLGTIKITIAVIQRSCLLVQSCIGQFFHNRFLKWAFGLKKKVFQGPNAVKTQIVIDRLG
jgi:hypothetical protein